MFSKQRALACATLAIAGILAALSSAQAGSFNVRVFEIDGLSLVKGEALKLEVTDTKGKTSTFMTTGGTFNITVNCDPATTDKSLTFKFYRRGVPAGTVDFLNGVSTSTQLLDVIIP